VKAPCLALSRQALAANVHEDLRQVLRAAGKPDTIPAEPLAEWALSGQGELSEAEILAAYVRVSGLPLADEEQFATLDRMGELTYDYLSSHACLPLGWDEVSVSLAVWHPYGLVDLAQQWRALLGRTPTFQLARRALIEQRLTSLYDVGSGDKTRLDWSQADSEEALKDLAREAPVVRLVNDMFNRAVELEASDIHVEPSENDLAIRYRIDGILHTVLTPPLSYYPAIASRIKLLANMNIAERRLPQDGRTDLTIGRAQIDVRVSTVPSMHGESIVLRLLPKDVSVFNLDTLGFTPDTRERLDHLLTMPHGILLVVGPTGSGKTTTLYSMMKAVNDESLKIITIEDPVEYQIPGLTQIQVQPKIGLTFANGLRSIVRQDPDIILVGEIRDRETAEIAVHAALTGHLVFSTLHTNDAPGAISRLQEMGIEGFLLSSALLGVLSQRLLRRLCPACAGKEDAPDPGKRCRTCSGTGYKGRVGIFELLVVDEELRRAINDRRDSTELAKIAKRHGMKALREDGEAKVAAGVTTAAEVSRVCQLDVGIEV